MTREVLKLALEALEKPWRSGLDSSDVITAIKAALAQPDEDELIIQYHEATIKRLENRIDELMAEPEQNLACKSTQARLAASWGYVKAQPEQYSDIVSDGGLDPRNKPEQEPVAWQLTFRDEYDNPRREVLYSKKHLDSHVEHNTNMRGLVCLVTPLYTSPPKRQPLTDKKISDLWCEVSNTDYVTADTHVFARAIEAKHGIGDKT